MTHLPLDDTEGLLLELAFALVETQDLHGVGNRGEWTAEFMAEHGQELVLSAGQVGQGLRLLACPLLQQAALVHFHAQLCVELLRLFGEFVLAHRAEDQCLVQRDQLGVQLRGLAHREAFASGAASSACAALGPARWGIPVVNPM